MAVYGYVAIDKSGKEVKASLQADSQEKAIQDLKNQGYMLLSIKEQNALTKDINFDIGGKPKSRDLSVFCRQFVSMTKAGVSILDALRLLTEQTENKKLRQAIRSVQGNVEKGETMAQSMKEESKVFPPLLINMVSAGESSGSLEISLERMAVQFDKSSKTSGQVKKAMVYPVVVGVVALIVIVVMLTFVIPTYEDMFNSLGTTLPAITVAVVNLSHFLRDYWFLIVPAVVIFALGLQVFKASLPGKQFFGKVAIHMPIFGRLTVRQASSQLARTLSTLIAAGIPLVEAVEIVAGTMENYWFKKALLEARDAIMVGIPLSVPLQQSGLFPPMVYHMIRIGEESGNTEDMLVKLADYYDEEVDLATQQVMAAMEPLIIITLALIVGVIIVAVMAPMVQMYTALDNL